MLRFVLVKQMIVDVSELTQQGELV